MVILVTAVTVSTWSYQNDIMVIVIRITDKLKLTDDLACVFADAGIRGGHCDTSHCDRDHVDRDHDHSVTVIMIIV